jgi:hypothetical protein
MRRFPVALAAFGLAALPLSPARAAEAEKGPHIAWARSWDDAVAEAAERNMPILLQSHART